MKIFISYYHCSSKTFFLDLILNLIPRRGKFEDI